MILSFSGSPRLPVCLATQLYSIGPWPLAHYPRMCDFWDTIVPTASLQFRVDDLQTKTLSFALLAGQARRPHLPRANPRLGTQVNATPSKVTWCCACGSTVPSCTIKLN